VIVITTFQKNYVPIQKTRFLFFDVPFSRLCLKTVTVTVWLMMQTSALRPLQAFQLTAGAARLIMTRDTSLIFSLK
jgi:hypothetical protein